MRYFTVNNFIKEILNFNGKAKTATVIFSVKDGRKDKFDKYNYTLLMIVIADEEGKKTTMNFNDITNKFKDMVSIKFNNEYPYDDNEFGVCSIETEELFFKMNAYHNKKYLVPGANIIKLATIEYNHSKEFAAPIFDLVPETFDI